MKDAEFWKDELFRERLRIRERIEEEGPERLANRSILIERFVFVTAYMMRKLNEAFALSEEAKESQWPVTRFACTQPPPPRGGWFQVSEDGETWRQPLAGHYDLAMPRSTTLPFPRLCDYLIHHFAFEARQQPNTGDLEFLFNSDRTQDRLYGMRLDDYIGMVEEVAYDQIAWVDMNQSTGTVKQWRHRPPES